MDPAACGVRSCHREVFAKANVTACKHSSPGTYSGRKRNPAMDSGIRGQSADFFAKS